MPSWTQAIRGSSPPPLSLECKLYPPFLQPGHFQGCRLERVNAMLRPSRQNMWLNPVKAALQTFKSLAVGLEALLLPPKSSVPYVSSHAYENLPPTNLEWPTYFSCLSLPSGGSLLTNRRSDFLHEKAVRSDRDWKWELASVCQITSSCEFNAGSSSKVDEVLRQMKDGCYWYRKFCEILEFEVLRYIWILPFQ